MSITDELREYANKVIHREDYMAGLAFDLNRIADRIDGAIANECVRLPKDANGEVIHFGDVLDQFGTPMTVYAMSDPDPDQGDCMLELITDGLDKEWVRARKMRHHRQPTVEDVLREFAGMAIEHAWPDFNDLVDVYAKRIREVVEHGRD